MVDSPDNPPLDFRSRRSPTICTHGVAAASQPLAAEIGLRVLRSGGNAADACVAMAAALNCVEPCMTGIGGDAFCLYFDAASGEVHGLNGSGRSPAALDLATAQASLDTPGRIALDPSSPHCVTVPGAAAAWCDAIERFGSMPLATVLQPAIDLAEEGFPVNVVAATQWAAQEAQLTRWGASNPGASALLRDGKAPKAGELMRMPELASTFRALAERGKAGFYSGRVASAVCEVLQAHGGLMTEADLAAHRSTFDSPVCVDFRGVKVWEMPPSGQGLVALLALRTLSRLPQLDSLPHNSAEYLHLVAEALRLAFADGAACIGDGGGEAGAAEEIARLLSDDYSAARASLVDSERAAEHLPAAAAALASTGTDTVYMTAVDGQGNACSFINSNFMGFGSGLVPRGCGFSLQNRGANFLLTEGHPNSVEPGKRPYHTIIPGMATVGRELFASFGVMGGFMQPQGHVQARRAALDAPRLCVEATGGAVGLQEPASRHSSGVVLLLEDGIPDEVAEELRRKGHAVRGPVCGEGRLVFGKGQVIQRRAVPSPPGAEGPRAVLWAGSDGRADGAALGW
ncbi:gamma-glutamyl transferase [Emiliania huxleyi CCMP1516]|uniref:Gamma-glutamyltransferase n=2 Tax=Emiliania huxleyi TaxID=2903 RepID=A0A0D3ILI2_EMIH1|nr:gamma-glutamyl transferase [Emiliania huxleyi CCMP1516]EOD12117.1 gamma-glutamyl transferase [Emiliania huxleyi CCMP1516]|eukprot:XP_005764546.1 gamma-glutamyl transferase [Emiliania huxleyi CCMP1516]